MQSEMHFTHHFVEYIPAELESGILYVSIPFATAVHKCACGCGREVVTPLSPTGWQVTFDGKTVSLSPSIGNWSFPCRSHYWITRDRILWAKSMSEREIEAGRRRDRSLTARHYDDASQEESISPIEVGESRGEPRESFWRRLRNLLSR